MRRIDSQGHSNVASLKGMPRLRFSRKKVALALAIVAGGGALFAGWTMWRASRALGEATQKVSSASVIRFSVKPLTPIVPRENSRTSASCSTRPFVSDSGEWRCAWPWLG